MDNTIYIVVAAAIVKWLLIPQGVRSTMFRFGGLTTWVLYAFLLWYFAGSYSGEVTASGAALLIGLPFLISRWWKSIDATPPTTSSSDQPRPSMEDLVRAEIERLKNAKI